VECFPQLSPGLRYTRPDRIPQVWGGPCRRGWYSLESCNSMVNDFSGTVKSPKYL
jgi:hypothetical protein